MDLYVPGYDDVAFDPALEAVRSLSPPTPAPDPLADDPPGNTGVAGPASAAPAAGRGHTRSDRTAATAAATTLALSR